MSKGISLKLKTRTQAEALLTFFTEYVVNATPDDLAESLLKDIMMKVFKKLRTKVENYDQHGWNLSLSTDEAKAYFIYWQNRAIDYGYTFEKSIVQSHLAQIEQVHG